MMVTLNVSAQYQCQGYRLYESGNGRGFANAHVASAKIILLWVKNILMGVLKLGGIHLLWNAYMNAYYVTRVSISERNSSAYRYINIYKICSVYYRYCKSLENSIYSHLIRAGYPKILATFTTQEGERVSIHVMASINLVGVQM